jgi:radical SAM superfamily enzyme YgiQ (UPF0313 family)
MSESKRLPLLLINAPYPRHLKFPGQPTSLLYAAAPTVQWLEAKMGRGSVKLLNYNLMDPVIFAAQGASHLRSVLRECRPIIVGISTTTASLPAARLLAAEAKRGPDSPIVVFGGPHEDDAAQKTAEWDANVDLSVSGDGESALHAIVETAIGYEVTQLNHVLDLLRSWIRIPRRPVFGSALITARGPTPMHRPELFALRGQWASLDSLPPLPRHLVDQAERFHYPIFRNRDGAVKATAQVMTARGCIAKCSFCSESAKLQQRSVQSVIKEIEGLKSNGYDAIFFDDSTFTNTSTARREFIHDLGLAMSSLGVEWGCQTRVDCVDINILQDMANQGCSYIYFGIESFVPHLLRALGKHYAIKRIDDTLLACRQLGIRVGASLLLGAHDENHRSLETIETARTTFTKVREYVDRGPIRIVSLNLFAYYPGTTSTQQLAALRPDVEDYRRYLEQGPANEFPFTLLEEFSSLCPAGLLENAREMLLLAHDLLGDVLASNNQQFQVDGDYYNKKLVDV